MLFTFAPEVSPCTLTVKLQVVFAGIVSPLTANDPPPGAAVSVGAGALHAAVVDCGFGVAVLVSPAGYVSVNAAPLIAALLAAGLVTVIVITVAAPMAPLAGVNALVTVELATLVSVAVAGPPVTGLPPTVPVIVPVELSSAPPAVLVTLVTVIVQVVDGAMVSPESARLLVPATAVAVPPVQPAAGVIVAVAPAALSIPAG